MEMSKKKNQLEFQMGCRKIFNKKNIDNNKKYSVIIQLRRSVKNNIPKYISKILDLNIF
jgi:hypothetical protein